MRPTRFLLALFLIPSPCLAQTEVPDPATATHDLRVELRSDQPLFADLRFEVRLSGEASSAAKAKKLEYRMQSHLEYVDELLARDQPAAGDIDIRRTYLRWEEDVTEGRGKPVASDNSIVGSRALITRHGKELGMELVDRLAPKKELEILLRHSDSAFWIELPVGIHVGETFQADPTGLVCLVVGDEFKARSSPSKFTLRDVDGDGVATLDSPIVAMVEDEESHGTFEGLCTLAVDTRGKFVRGMDWKGTTLLLMEGGAVQAKFKGNFDARLSVQAGDASRKALERKPNYRSIPRKLKKAPLTIELPSHWYAVEGEEAETFRTTVHGAESPFTLELQFFDVSSQEFDSVVDSAVSKLGKDFRLSGMKNITSPLGKGRTMRFQTKSDDGAVYSFLLEFHPCGPSQMVRTRLVGPESSFDTELREWPSTLRTFELGTR